MQPCRLQKCTGSTTQQSEKRSNPHLHLLRCLLRRCIDTGLTVSRDGRRQNHLEQSLRTENPIPKRLMLTECNGILSLEELCFWFCRCQYCKYRRATFSSVNISKYAAEKATTSLKRCSVSQTAVKAVPFLRSRTAHSSNACLCRHREEDVSYELAPSIVPSQSYGPSFRPLFSQFFPCISPLSNLPGYPASKILQRYKIVLHIRYRSKWRFSDVGHS